MVLFDVLGLLDSFNDDSLDIFHNLNWNLIDDGSFDLLKDNLSFVPEHGLLLVLKDGLCSLLVDGLFLGNKDGIGNSVVLSSVRNILDKFWSLFEDLSWLINKDGLLLGFVDGPWLLDIDGLSVVLFLGSWNLLEFSLLDLVIGGPLLKGVAELWLEGNVGVLTMSMAMVGSGSSGKKECSSERFHLDELVKLLKKPQKRAI